MFVAEVRKKMKKILVLLMVCFLLVSCGIKEEKTTISVYKTDRYQAYKRMAHLAISSAEDSKILYKENRVQREMQYFAYELLDLKVLIEQTDAEITDYLLYVDGEYLTTLSFRNFSRSIEELTIYYIDITGDLKRDVVMLCEPPTGTNTSPYWSLAYDVYNNRKIGFFDEESGNLTALQKEQLQTIIDNDKNFKRLFPKYSGLGGSGAPRPCVDMFGEVYYEMAVWGKDSYIEAIGSVLVMLKYDKENNRFDVGEITYMPLEVKD